MKLRISFIVLVLLGFIAQSFAGDEIMPLSEVKPGMRGVAKTVFSGEEIEAFDLEVIDIIPNFRAKRDLILVKLLGDKVLKTGVVAGMSGSPVYIDGKLVGAISYSMGIFLKDPIAGITPIEQMLDIVEREKVRKEELAAQAGDNPEFLKMANGLKDVTWDALTPPDLKRNQIGETAVSNITPLSIPLVLSGFERQSLQLSSNIFSGAGFQVLEGGTAVYGTKEQDLSDLEPGSAFSVVLVDGDFGVQATGTVTYRDGDQILGMGHPFFNSGAVDFPMGKAKILTTLSSLMFSTKMSALTEVVGTIHQDRTTGMLGVMGEEPRMIPVHLSYESKFQKKEEYNFRVAEERSLFPFTPLILRIVLTNALESVRLSTSDQTLRLTGKIELEGYPDIELENYYAGGLPSTMVTDALEATGDISASVGALLSNAFEAPRIKAIDLDFHSLPKKKVAIIKRMELDKTVVNPGDEVTVSVTLQEYQAKEFTVQHVIKIPDDLTDKSLVIYAGSGNTLTQLEYRSAPQKFAPKDFSQLLDLLQNRRENNYLFFQLRTRDSGLIVDGQELPSLPPSILSIMQKQKTSNSISSLRDRVVFEDQAPLDYSLQGGQVARLKVKPKNH